MTQVTPNFKALVVCGCSDPECGEGIPRTKRNRDGTFHTRACTCKSCTSGQHAKNEKKRVRRFATRSGLTQASGSGRRLGYDLGGSVAVEETSAQEIVGPVRGWWARVDVQRKVRRVREQRRLPWAIALSWDDDVRLVVTDAASFSALCLAACGSDMEAAASLIAELHVDWKFPPCELAGDDA